MFALFHAFKFENKCLDQGRLRDFSEGGARFISERKNPDLGTKRRGEEAKFFLTFLFCT